MISDSGVVSIVVCKVVEEVVCTVESKVVTEFELELEVVFEFVSNRHLGGSFT